MCTYKQAFMAYNGRRHKIVTLADLNKPTTYPTTTTMKLSVFAIATFAAATSTSSRYMVAAAAAAAARNRKVQKKTSSSFGPHSSEYGATESSGQPPGANCKNTSDCATPSGLDHPVCHDGTCKSGAPGSYCGVTSDCVVPPGLAHAVCRDGRCQSGTSGSSCGATSDCVVPFGMAHAVCRNGKCQRGVCLDYCGNDSDCITGLVCAGCKQCVLRSFTGFDDVRLTCPEANNVPGSSCGANIECVVPLGLDHGVCRQGICQGGACNDYCGQFSDCLPGLYCCYTNKCCPIDDQYVSCQEFNNAA